MVSVAEQDDSELQALQAQSIVMNQQIEDARNKLVLDSQLLRSGFKGNFNQVVAEVDSLKATSPLGIGMWLAQVHPSSLSTLLAVMMGALGAMLFLFPAYVANKPEWEVTFAEALTGPAEDRQLAMAPTRLQEFVQRLRQAFDAAAAAGETPVLLTSTSIRQHVRAIVERVRPNTTVLAQTEIFPRARIRTVGTIA